MGEQRAMPTREFSFRRVDRRRFAEMYDRVYRVTQEFLLHRCSVQEFVVSLYLHRCAHWGFDGFREFRNERWFDGSRRRWRSDDAVTGM